MTAQDRIGVYEKLFGRTPDISQVRIPSKPEGVGAVRLIIVAHELIEWAESCPLQHTQDALKKHFPCWQYARHLDESIRMNDRDLKNGSYAVWVKDVPEADEENAGKSADDLVAENHTGITVLERQLFEADYFFDKGEHLDQDTITLCTGSCDVDGGAPCAHWDAGRFHVGLCESADSHPDLRSRRVWAQPSILHLVSFAPSP